MNMIKNSIMVGEDEDAVVQVKGDLKFLQADGFEVCMHERKAYTITGREIGEYENYDILYQFDGRQYKLENFKLHSDVIDYGAMSRKVYVRFIHSTDALMCRTVLRISSSMGISEIFSAHDCIRVQASDMPRLRKSIDKMYLELFGTMEDVGNDNLFPEGLDILKNFFKGVFKINGGKMPIKHHSQFFGSDKSRPQWRTLTKNYPDFLRVLRSKITKYWG